jgi:hypothetical protein
MSDLLRLEFKPDTDGTGELFAEVHCEGFAGSSSAWFGEDQLVAFARKLAAAFPLQKDEPLALKGGYWSKAGTGIEQLHVGLEFYPIGSVGRVGCQVSLNKPDCQLEPPRIQFSLAVELQTTYAQIGIFAKSLEMLAKGQTNEAVLKAEG